MIRLLGDFDAAEEAMQDAFAAALEQWPSAGTPPNPRAWLVSTARHKAIDKLRRRARFEEKREEIAAIAALEQEERLAEGPLEALGSAIPDDLRRQGLLDNRPTARISLNTSEAPRSQTRRSARR